MVRPRGDDVFAPFKAQGGTAGDPSTSWVSILLRASPEPQGLLGAPRPLLLPCLVVVITLAILVALSLSVLNFTPRPILDSFDTLNTSTNISVSGGAASSGPWFRPLGALVPPTRNGSAGAPNARSPSPSWFSHLWPFSQALRGSERERGSRSEKATACAEEALGSILEESEEQYQVNLKARLALVGVLPPKEPMDQAQLRTELLLPLYSCPLEGRFGSWGEGGKWVCLKHRRMNTSVTVMSVGSFNEVSFEKDVAERLNAFSHTFDMTLDDDAQRSMGMLPFLKFHNVGLAGSRFLNQTRAEFPGTNVVTIREVVRMTGWQYIDIFKIDCEGCEFGVVQDMREVYTRSNVPFGQILMEEHKVDEP